MKRVRDTDGLIFWVVIVVILCLGLLALDAWGQTCDPRTGRCGPGGCPAPAWRASPPSALRPPPSALPHSPTPHLPTSPTLRPGGPILGHGRRR